MAKLVLVRHGESEWNAKGLWTGWTDVSLTEKGKEEARHAGEALNGIQFDAAYTSKLVRAQQTLDEIKKTLEQDIPTIESSALNERNYGVYTAKNKWEVEKEVGEKRFLEIRRGWDVDIPEGESLKQVFERVVPYYKVTILPRLEKNENILIAAHGNSLRALIKYLENIPDDKIGGLELATGEGYVYEIDSTGKVTGKEIKDGKHGNHRGMH
jgi:2,3-bisphosphoglycerate-dependent phosphoglycerate mutase